MTSTKADKLQGLQGTCSVCLRPMQLHRDKPIRHGFSAVGVRHGQHGGFHTGPCGGSAFPHLGISTEGTRWARDHANEALAKVRADLATLATNPDLVYYPKKYDVRGGRPDLEHPITIKYGDAYDSKPATAHPSYADEHRQRTAKLTAREHELERAIAEYDRVISTWSPEKYPVTGTVKKVDTVHMEMPRRNSRGEEWTGILCRRVKPHAAPQLPKTNDPAKVTCKRCRALLGLPPP